MKKEPTKYRLIMMSSEKDVSVFELWNSLKKLKGWTMSRVEMLQEPGYIDYTLKLTFIK